MRTLLAVLVFVVLAIAVGIAFRGGTPGSGSDPALASSASPPVDMDSSRLPCDEITAPRSDFGWGLYQIYWGPDHFETMLRRSLSGFSSYPHYVTFYRDLGQGRGFPRRGCEIIRKIGAEPVISLELWHWGKNPQNVLPRIAEGGYDDYFRAWAAGAREYGDAVYLRFGFEMNGDWFTWGNQPTTFVNAWKRIHGIFDEAGATNVIWVWTPNNVSIPRTDENAIELYFPGVEYVDWIGLDGYNFGDNHSQWHSWSSFEEVFEEAMSTLDRLAPDVPVMISEFGCAPGPGSQKGDWIQDAYCRIGRHPRVRAAIWFNHDKRKEGEPNWLVSSDSGALEAFNATFANPVWPNANRID